MVLLILIKVTIIYRIQPATRCPGQPQDVSARIGREGKLPFRARMTFLVNSAPEYAMDKVAEPPPSLAATTSSPPNWILRCCQQEGWDKDVMRKGCGQGMGKENRRDALWVASPLQENRNNPCTVGSNTICQHASLVWHNALPEKRNTQHRSTLHVSVGFRLACYWGR